MAARQDPSPVRGRRRSRSSNVPAIVCTRGKANVHVYCKQRINGKQLVFSSERSPFTVPVAHKLNMEEFERELHSTLNGHGNIFTIPVEALELKKEE